ncbi:unnamed protein product [Cuscuta campestris]|uniref:non-specific serine/threonine protein kinase n=2 Tax=Cuscuta sect. Cleistogrammica TaxID=1824901 RepID=A0A484MF13_9ASTE|nr:hypothetical protein DM860_006761 [Cuscuta australis]VFQ86698.1 unnamed protein product [Cuscuta campestris]
MDLEEGVGESSSPPRTLDSVAGGGGEGGGAHDVRHHVYNKLLERGNEEVVGNPELLREMLETHFNSLPSSYGLDINMDKVEDVLLHRDLLAKAKDPDKRPVYHVRLLELNSGATRVDDTADQQISNIASTSNLLCDIDNEGIVAPPRSRPQISFIPSYEIIFSTLDKPKLLSQLSALLSDIGLNIREAHVFSTTDGYSLSVFVVDGWHVEKPNGLLEALEKAVDKRKVMLSKNSCDQSCMEKAICLEEESRDWEIDRSLVKIGEKIASGSGVDLYRGIYHGLDVAVKVFRSDDLDQKLKDEFAQEVYILRHVQHKNVVRFIGACSKLPHLWIVTEYMSVGSLFDYLRKGLTVLKLPQLLRFAIDISEGMEYLHQNNIIHRDLKTANLLIDAQNVVKVADFGIARFLNKGGVMTAETGTYRWMAPEIMNHQPYDQRADVFSFGIVLWELLTSKVPYDNMTPIQAAVGVNQGLRPQLPEDTHPKLLDVMQRCWQAAPDNRPSFSEIKAELEELLHEVEQTEDGAEVPKES